MNKVVVRNPFPAIDRDSFLTPFDKMFDEINTFFSADKSASRC